MYMVRNVWKCARGKVPECLVVVKEVSDSWAKDGNKTGKTLAVRCDLDALPIEEVNTCFKLKIFSESLKKFGKAKNKEAIIMGMDKSNE